MAQETRGIVLAAHGQPPTCERIIIQQPGPHEVGVRMIVSGLCHTDLAAVRDARVTPVLLGHEGAGVVEQVGRDVTHVHPGDHVVINWQPRCGQCRRCAAGREDLCENIQGTAAPRAFWRGQPLNLLLQAGTFSPYVVVPAQGAIPIRHDLPFEQAALLGCAVATGVGAALYTAHVQAGEGVVVLGVGGVGVNVIQGARLAHAHPIIAIDRDEQRLDLARACGATHIINTSAEDALRAVQDLTNGRGIEYVFEVVGVPDLMEQGIEMLARGGMLIMVGAAARDATMRFHPRRFMSQQQSIVGCIYGNIRPFRDVPLFADWAMSGTLRLDLFPLRTIRLEDAPAAFRETQTGGELRTIIRFEDIEDI